MRNLTMVTVKNGKMWDSYQEGEFATYDDAVAQAVMSASDPYFDNQGVDIGIAVMPEELDAPWQLLCVLFRTK